MAFVEGFARGNRVTVKRQPTNVTCHYSVSTQVGGKLLQLDTFGSADRKNPDKVSQSLQLNEQGARELINILEREFGLK